MPPVSVRDPRSRLRQQDRLPEFFGTHGSFSTTGPIAYHSFSGADIVAQIVIPGEKTPITLGELQTISYSTHRENTPVRFVGHVNPVGFVKGPRTIAGSLIFTQFHEYAFYRLEQFRRSVDNGMYPLAD